MLKIAMVNTARHRGGAARMAANLTVALNDAGVAATLYHSEDNDRTPPFCGLKKASSRQINALLARVGGSLCVADLGFTDTLLRSINDADVLHLHNIHGYYLDYRKLLTAWHDRPIVWTWHDMWGATGRCGAGYECTLWQSGCQRCPHMEFYPSAWIDRAANEFRQKNDIYQQVQNLWIVSPSAWMAKIAETRGFNPSHNKIIPNPVNKLYHLIAKDEARNTLGLPRDQFIAMFIASDCRDPRKGYQDFAKVVEHLAIDGIAVGMPPNETSPRIKHVGPITDAAKINLYYAASDAMILPSFAENYPNTALEAIASGTPVFGYDVGGVASQLDMPYCSVVDIGAHASMAAAIRPLLQAGGKTPEMSSILSAAAIKRWDAASVAKQYSDLYKNIATR
jgi:putative colanic acid biosynthesis glycosyltransferase